MDRIEIVTVGRLKSHHKVLESLVEEYLKRLRPYATVTLTEVADETFTPTQTVERVLAKEADRLKKQLSRAKYRVMLTEHGKCYSSQVFSQELRQRLDFLSSPGGNPPNGGIEAVGSGPMMMVIGGAYGLANELIQSADWCLSLSPMTFPHPMARLLLLEQLYRAFKIERGEPYHK